MVERRHGLRFRPGNNYTIEGGVDYVRVRIRWAGKRVRSGWLTLEAGFPLGDFLQCIETEGVRSVPRLRTNSVLNERADPYLK